MDAAIALAGELEGATRERNEPGHLFGIYETERREKFDGRLHR